MENKTHLSSCYFSPLKFSSTTFTALLILHLFLCSTYAGRLVINNITNDAQITNGTFSIMRIGGSNEYYDVYDFPPPPLPPSDILTIYSTPYSSPLAIDARPLNSTTSIDITLGVEGLIESAENSLRFQVLNVTGFEHRVIEAQQISPAVGVVHTIPNDGSIYSITLPDLINQGEGFYAVWRITVDRILSGDLNEDGVVDFFDYAVFANEFLERSSDVEKGGNYLVSDVDHNRTTDLQDFKSVVETWLEEE